MNINVSAGHGQANGITTGIDWKSADVKSESGRADLADAISGYFKDLRGNKLFTAKSTRPGHIAGLPAMPALDLRFYGPQEDYGVLSLFRGVDMTASKNSTYQVGNVNAGSIVFEQLEPGQPARVRKASGGSPISVSSVTWGGALGIDDDAQRFDMYSVFEENVQAAPTKWMDTQSTSLTTLFTALGAGVNETWSANLITTINNACAQIIEDCGDTYGLPDRPTFGLYYNHRQWNLVLQALTANLTLPNNNNSAAQLQYDIMPVQTRKIPSGSMYICLPGYDMVQVTWDDLFSEFGRDYKRGVDTFVYRARMNAAIGNTKQVRRITPQ